MRQIRLSVIVPAMGLVLLLLLGYSPAAHAQSVVTEPVGFITLSFSQVLRIGATAAGSGPVTVRFRRIGYDQAPCQDGICKYTVSSQITSAPIVLASGEVATMDVSSVAAGVRALVLSSNANVRVTATLVDTVTGQIQTITVAPPGQ